MAVQEKVLLGPAHEFAAEFTVHWRALPFKGLFFSLLLAWVAFFHWFGNSTIGYVHTGSIFGWLNWVYGVSPDDEHGKLIPFVVLALMWWKRRQLQATPKRIWWPALGLLIFAVLLHMGGYWLQQTRISVIAFFVGIYALMGLVWGPAWLKACFFPYFLFAFCIPVAAFSDTITFPLRVLVTNISVGISQHLLAIDVIKAGTMIYDSRLAFQYDVAPACSGIRSLTVLVALTTIYGWMRFQSPWKRLLMVLATFPIAVAGNVVRITGVIITAEAFGQNAGTTFHNSAGFVTFAVALGCVLALGYWLKEDYKSGWQEQSV